MTSSLARTATAAGLAALLLALLDLLALVLLFPGLFSGPGGWLLFLASAAGILGSVLLPGTLLLAVAAVGLQRGVKRAWARHAVAGGALAALVLLLNAGRLRHQLWFVGLMAAGAFVFGTVLALVCNRLAQGGPRQSWAKAALPAAALLLALLLFAGDALVLRGLYPRQHLTVGLVTWLLLLAASFGVLALLEKRATLAKVLRAVVLIVALFAVLLVWAVPPEAVSMKSRLLVAHTSTATREAWHLLAAATDFDLDGTSGLLGAGDCAPFEASVGPGQRELPADGIDQNCLAGDPSFPQPGTGDKRFAPRLRPKALPVRNLVLLSLDALRYDRVDSDKANPYLALLAARGLLFERAYCPFPGTILSLYSAMTSTYPSTVRLSRFYNFEVPADKRGTTLFEAVGDAGVRTEGLVFHQTLEPRFGTTRGMDRVWTAGSSGAEISTDRTVEQALSFLAGIGQERFLLWVHFYDPHAPYEVEGEAELEPESRYDREVARAAAGVEAMMEELAGRDLLRNTAVLFFADHGEEFGDHGAAFHGQTLYDEAVRVPLLLVAPGLAAGRVSSPVSLLDLPPTAMELLGLDAHIPDGWVGRSLLEAPAGPVFVEVFQPGGTQRLHGVLRWPWKLIYRQDSNLFELYDLANDPTERMNLYDPVPDVAADLASLLDSHLAFDLVR